ncbi:hypothetical protein EKG37_21065 [Robertmurraya yapensis]|uniref:Uncharacterized protein n=2 Tax=Bacillaceae TaxID=186817 RepID=A0A3S0REN4_9BACI|nr:MULTISPECIES: hypothetical protein [Bacillaceae]RTR26564.1 hypothetical protein EKG37_21065 [Bacillus yapensis]TKC15057.1 hypothetical protein FA727_19370 [Robertmurraya kyonggiensis]TKS93739.1 hypothetical protein FAR12_21070 [Bacillus yapensis]
MTNTPILFITLEAVIFFEKPYFDGNEWHNLSLGKDEKRVFLSETRTALLGFPVEQNEEPAGYVFSVYGLGDECYIPVYDRTDLVDLDYLYPKEVVTNLY